MMTVRILTACIIAALPCSTLARAQSQNGDFSQVTHERIFTFMTRDRQCTRGTIENTDSQSVTVHSGSNNETFLKKDLLFVGENFQRRNILLSGRSSWYDVTRDLPEAHESFRITLNSGETVSASKITGSPNSLTLGSGRHQKTTPKQEIKSIEYVRYLPTTDKISEAYQGLNFFQPEFYRQRFGHPPTIAVKLYDTALPEDNTELYCK